MFSVLVLGVMMLLIPATSIANAQEYKDPYYNEQDQYYGDVYRDNNYKKSNYENEPYKKQGDKTDEPVIIIKNEPIQKKEKKMKESPMIIVKKDVLYCDSFSGSNDQRCIDPIPPPNNERWIQTCTLDNEVCNNIDEEFFKMILTDDIEFSGSEDGTKLNLNGERFTVTEEANTGHENQELISLSCQESGFDEGFLVNENIIICTEFEGECSGIVERGELKECTIKNYVVEVPTTKLTVNKEIYGCDDIFSNSMSCDLDNENNLWMLCDELIANNVPDSDRFCNPLEENKFDIEMFDINNNLIDPPGQFEGSTEGTMIMNLEPGTYNVTEIIHNNDFSNQLNFNEGDSNVCTGLGFVDGGRFANSGGNGPVFYTICFEYEDENDKDCSLIDLKVGDNKTCTVKNYIQFGVVI